MLWLLTASGCVQQAVLENDVRNAQWKARTLSTATNLSLAEAALSAQLVELEALYQRDPAEPRVLQLLDAGYRLMAQGFIEARRLEALAEADNARAVQEAQLKADAVARADFYGAALAGRRAPATKLLAGELAEAALACRRRQRATYEEKLNSVLSKSEVDPEGRLQAALSRRLARAWLQPRVAARCAF